MGLSQINAMSFEFSWDSKRLRIFSVDQARIQSAGTRCLNILDVHLNSTSPALICLTLNCIPARMYVWIRKMEGDRTEYDTDTFGRIEAINMTMGNTHLLNSASEQDLWRMSVDNGLKTSFPEWHDYYGWVLCIDFVGLPPNQYVGMTTHTQFQIDTTWSALNPVEQGYELNTLSVLPG